VGDELERAPKRKSLKSNGPEFESQPSQRFNNLSMVAFRRTGRACSNAAHAARRVSG
jgi:hypothetical protein